MHYELIITEKPSAALKIAVALSDSKFEKKSSKGVPYYVATHKGKPIVIACAVGHLYTIAEKKKSFTYPVFDIKWVPTHTVDKNAKFSKKYLDALIDLAKSAKTFTVACDYDIEGEVIGLNCIKYACKQDDAARMKYSTLTKPDLIESYSKKQAHLDWGQAHAGETRHKLDWIYGINLSRALTLSIRKNRSYKVLSIGRVQGPALKILVDREKEIKEFKPVKFWQIQLLGKIKSHPIEAWHEKDKFWEEGECNQALKKAKGHDGTVKEVSRSEFSQLPPPPFDLTTLQTESYRVFGISPKQTLSIAQELYLGGFISYPRTSSQKLPPTLGLKKILQEMSKQAAYKRLADLVLATKMVPRQGAKEDPAHPAIYPTGESGDLKPQEKKVYDLIVKRFFACFGETAIRETVKVDIDVNGELFVAKGTSTTKKGWHIFYEPYVKQEEITLPQVTEGDAVKVDKLVKHDKETQPPKRYTPASIIKELEKRGLGTKATRAAIIDSLYTRNYVTGKSLQATELGIQTIDIIGKYCPEIVDEELTKRFEAEMDEIRTAKSTPHKVIESAKEELTKILGKFKRTEKEIGKELAESFRETQNEENQIGPCTKCNSGTLRLIHSKKTRQRFIACDKYPDCKNIFNIPQTGKIQGAGTQCPDCGMPMVKIIKKKAQVLCINQDCKSKKLKDTYARKESKEMEKGIVEEECPKCKEGVLVVRKSVYGTFLGCSRFPKCRYTQRMPSEPLKEDFSKK